MDTSGIEATQALPIDDYEDEFDQLETGPVWLSFMCPFRKDLLARNIHCLKGLSREHACIEIHGDSHLIYDKGSRNRTRRNTDPAADDSDETGSESMFQTAPSDEMLDETREEPVNAESRLLGDPDEGLESDASCDILEPTQQNGNNELGSRSTMGDKTLDMVLPESGSDTEDEIDASKPPPTLHKKEEEDDDGKSDTSEEFVLEGDTDTEDNVNDQDLMAAPTLACETQAVDDTVAVGDFETQVIDRETDKQAELDETVAVTDGETQVIDEHASEEAFGTAREKCTVNFDDATQVIDDVDNEVKKGVEAEAGELETQVIAEDATQVIDVQPNIKGRKNSGDAYCVETQVFENESTQVFDNKKDTEDEMDSTQVFDNISPQNKVIKTPDINRQSGDNQATQVFDGDEHKNVSVGQENSGNLANEKFDDSDIEMFDINAAATLAHSHDESHINESVKKDQHHETDATQVLEDATVAVDDDELSSKKCPQKVQEEECTQVLDDATVAVVDSGESPVRENKVSRKMNVSDDATQVFDDATVAVEDEDESPVKKNKASQKLNVSDDATQVFDDATVAVVDEDEIPVRKSMANKNKLNISDDATQVFDDKTDEEKNDEKCKELKNTQVDTDATQVIEDATVDVSRTDPNAATQVFDEAVAVEDNYGKKKGKGKRTTKGKKVPGAAVHVAEIETDATQVLDDVNTDKKIIDQDATTQVFDEIVGGHEVVQNKSKRKGRKLAAEGEATHIDTEAATHEIEPETVPVEDLESGENDATENTESKTQPSAKRGRRGKATVENITLENTEKTNYQPKINSRSRRGRTNAEVEEAADDEKKETEEETKDVEHDHSIGRQSRSRNKKDVPATAKTSNRSTRGMKGINDEKHENEDNEDEKAKTSTEEHESEDKELEKAKTSNESTRKKRGKPAEDQEGQNEADEKEKKTANEEAATQVYASDSESEATQKFGVVDDDATQDLDEVTDISQTPPVPEVIVSPSKTPLKSALASPEKRKGSPSPKKVAFVKREEPMEMDCEIKVETSEDAKVKEEVTSHEEKPTRRGGRSKQAKANVKAEDGFGEVSAADESKTEPETFDKVVARRGKRMVKVEKDTKDLVSADLEKVETSEVDKVGARRGKSNVKIEKDTEELESADLEKVGKSIMKIEKDTDELVDTNSEKGETSQVHTVGPRRGKRGINKKKNTELKSSDMEIAETSEVPVKKSRRGGKLDETKDEEPSATNVEKRKSKIMMIEKIEDKCDEKESDNEIKVHSNDKPGSGNKQTRGRLNKAESESETANKNKVEITNRRGTRKNVSENPDAVDDGAIEEKAVITGLKRASRSKVRTDDVDKATHVDESVERKGKRATRNKTSEEDESSLSDGKQGSSGKANTSRDRATSSKGGEEKTEAEVEAHEDTEVVIEKVGRGKTNTRTKQKIVESQEDTKDNIKSQDDSEHKVTSGRKGRSVRSKQKPVENIEQSDNSENSSQDSIRGSRRTRQVKEESSDKNEVEAVGKRNGGQKRKESDSDSQKSEEEKPDKRQKTEAAATPASKRRSRNLAETPKHLHKRVSAVYTPKSTGKSVVSEVTNSPTLRKTTTEGHRAKVMFTGVVDEQGEKIVKDLGGELVGDVTMVTHLVTDQVRRTMKFLCCVARGVPIVSPEWLKASKDSGMFLDPTPFLVKDDASEKKYKFILHLSLDRARDKPMLQGIYIAVCWCKVELFNKTVYCHCIYF
ncbi:MDC1-like protein [Mya arenaria]|uniref:PAX-interacting protein 1 n=1 Tax=Mya arenaria TaxID=6604 RepID=A0ABY7FN18_MYAAR|nr:MDC1-like protein [Mya arenaria]